jgi:hypothetical protein
VNNIPSNEEIPVEIVSSIFNDTTNSYKFYWFIAILDFLQNNDSEEILIEDLCYKMLDSVWYPLNYFKLSFGKQDKFINISNLFHEHINVDNKETVLEQLSKIENIVVRNSIKKNINQLSRWVPYRFIRPFFRNQLAGYPDQIVNEKIFQIAQETSNKNPNLVPYYFTEASIVINKPWKDYFKRNIGLLRGFTFWKLVGFVQRNNPNAIGIPEKLFKPLKRNLTLNTKSWEFYLMNKGSLKCIFSRDYIPNNFSMDHFIPWTYVVHDLNWNILPVSKVVNSKKNNSIPSLDSYLNDFIFLQRDFYTCIYDSNFDQKNKIMEQYTILFGDSSSNIYNMPYDLFSEKLIETITPMAQIASNMGFNSNWVYK